MEHKVYSFGTRLFFPNLLILIGFLLEGCTIEPQKKVPEGCQLGKITFNRVCAQSMVLMQGAAKELQPFYRKGF